jgi:hypothetical protein
MSRLKVVVLGIAGLLLPVMLATAAFMIPSRVDASISPPAGTQLVDQTNPEIRDSGGPGNGLIPASPTSTVDDRGGRCSEPEHQNDPECQSGSTGTTTPAPSPSPTDDGGGNSGKGGDGDNSGPSNPTPTPTQSADDKGGSGGGGDDSLGT